MRTRLAIGVFVVAASVFGCASAPKASTLPSPTQPPGAISTLTTAPTLGATATAAAAIPTPTPTATVAATPINESAGYTDLKGWIVFEHFGQKPDGSTPDFNFDLRMIWLVRADGSDLHELAPRKPFAGKMSPDISADGKSVAFSSWAPLQQIWEVSIDGGEPRLISTDCSGRSPDCQELDPSYSTDGKRIAFVRFDAKRADTEIGIRDLATGKLVELTSTRMPVAQGYVAQPSWSPDGKEIVYYRNLQTSSDQHITDARLFVAAADGSATRELPQPAGAWAADPDWSPDGSLIVFSSAPNRETEGWAGGPHGGIYTIHPDGSALQQVCVQCLNGGSAPSWTPDGKHIMFWGYQSWAVMDPDGKKAAHINQPKLTWFADGLGYGYAGFLAPVP
jgi:Tol biopolymer transport system component